MNIMTKTKFILILIGSFCLSAASQNLISNPGFEALSSDFAQEFPTNESTRDVMKECGSCLNSWSKSGPAWADLYIKIVELPHSRLKRIYGKSYAAIEVIPHGDHFTNRTNNGFLGTMLKTPMITGKEYHVSFQVALSKNMSTISPNNIGILFSEELTKVENIRSLQMKPQIYFVNTIDSTGEFDFVETEFIADKSYKYAILGCFTDGANFKMQSVVPEGKSEYFSELNGVPRAIFLIDEVSVLEILDDSKHQR
jgi:hypothetical protein